MKMSGFARFKIKEAAKRELQNSIWDQMEFCNSLCITRLS